jgi:hypothetical protein
VLKLNYQYDKIIYDKSNVAIQKAINIGIIVFGTDCAVYVE